MLRESHLHNILDFLGLWLINEIYIKFIYAIILSLAWLELLFSAFCTMQQN